MEQAQANQIRENIAAEIYNQLKDLKAALNNICTVSEHDVEFVQEMSKEDDTCEHCLCAEAAYTTIRQAVIDYLLECEQELDVCEDLQLAVLETIKSRPTVQAGGTVN